MQEIVIIVSAFSSMSYQKEGEKGKGEKGIRLAKK